MFLLSIFWMATTTVAVVSKNTRLTHLRPMFYFFTPLKTSENLRFSDMSRGIEMQHWPEMG